jgi:hypothetical protein
MTGQEEQMLNDLVQKINGTSLQEKDDDAERLLRDGLGRNPDAMYMLAQTVLVQNMAIEQARQQISAMQQQMQQAPQPAKATSFLGSLLGHHEPQPQQAPYQPVQYAQQPQYAQQSMYQPAPVGQPSFLRSAATTAAGVAAGALAFEGIESMLHGGGMFGGGYGGGFGGGGFGGGGFEAPREEIVNNYYGDAPGQNDNQNWGSGPDEQPQGPFDTAGDSNSYGDDFSDGGGDFGGDDDSNFS